MTVQELITYLDSHFNSHDRLCYWHEGGAWIECEPVFKSDLGRTFLRTVKQDKRERFKCLTEKEQKRLKNDYRLVGDSDVIIY